MLKIREYVKAQSLEQAYELNQKKSNRIIGGMLWLKMSHLNVGTAIDLSGLGLDKIEETEDCFKIGCTATLRDIEKNVPLNEYTGGAVRNSVKDIVGVQFRNLATVGGSIYSRFGFSDPLAMFLALDSYAELYKGGIVPLAEYNEMKKDRDILTGIIIKKQKNLRCSYLAYRNQRTDFPVINVCTAVSENRGIVTVGARPMRAKRYEFDIPQERPDGFGKMIAEKTAEAMNFGSNMRAGADYRRHLAKVLAERGLEKCL